MVIAKLFDGITRDYSGPALYAEPRFDYLNRSARPRFYKIRSVLEEWFSHYPITEQGDFLARFKSSNDSQHYSAFFELFLHELLLKLGYCVDIHPTLKDNTARHPDFLAKSKSCGNFYLEGVLATDESEEKVAAKARMNIVYDVINKMDSPNFFIGMKISGSPKTPPSATKIKSFLKKRLDKLNPDYIAKLQESKVPQWTYEHDGWQIDFYPIPKSPKSRGKLGIRPIAIHSTEAHFLDTKSAIRNVIIKKASSYGDLDLPYVIAVNCLGECVEKIDIMEALFGKEQYIFHVGESKLDEPTMARAPDGVWISKSGPRYTRISAVLVVYPVTHHNIPRTPICIYHNPWAKRKYTSQLTRLPQAIPQDGKMKWLDGESLGTIFNLSNEWPEEESMNIK